MEKSECGLNFRTLTEKDFNEEFYDLIKGFKYRGGIDLKVGDKVCYGFTYDNESTDVDISMTLKFFIIGEDGYLHELIKK